MNAMVNPPSIPFVENAERDAVCVSTIKRVSDAVDLERPGSGTWKPQAGQSVHPPDASGALRDL